MGRLHRLRSIASTIEGEVTAASFFEAASNDSLDLNGMVPVIDLLRWFRWTAGLLPSVQPGVRLQQLSNGEVVPIDNEFFDVGDLAQGIAP